MDKIVMRFSLLTGLVMAVAVLNGCGKPEAQLQAPKPTKAALVKTLTVVPGLMENSVEVVGTVAAKVTAKIIAPADGSIEKLHVRENDPVHRNQIVAVLSSIDRMALLGETQARVEQARQSLQTASASNGKSNEFQQQLEKAEEDHRYAEQLFLGTPIVSPISGRVIDKPIELGSVVSARQTLLTVADTKQLIIETAVSELFLSKIKLGQKIPVKVHAYPEEIFFGALSLISPQVEVSSRTVGLEVRVGNIAGKLKPGMLATLTFIIDRKDDALALPNDVILVKPDGEKTVFVVQDSVAHERTLTTGMSNKSATQVLTGLQAGEKVVVMGQELLKDGMKVKIQEPKKEPARKATDKPAGADR